MNLLGRMRSATMRRAGSAFPGILIVGLALFAAPLTPGSAANHSERSVTSPWQPLVEPYGWPESTPEDEGMDSAMLATALEDAAATSYMYGLVVIRHGRLVAEGYFNGQTRYDANHIHSASKSFTSTLVGIAFDHGYLESLDQKLPDFFPDYVTADMDPRKHDITIRHLLAMQAGFDWDDTEANWIEYSRSPNWVRYALELPLRHDPGERFNYSTVQTNLLSAILTRATGMSTREFAERFLFEPLQISIAHWHRDPQGYYTGGHEMYYVPRDMARLGYLFLHHGSVDGQEIVSAEWVGESIRRTADVPGGSPVSDRGYGFQWWLGRLAGYPIFYASGKGGQHIITFPDLDMIVVTTTNGDAWDNQVAIQPAEVMRIVADHIVPAVFPEDSALFQPNQLQATVLSPTRVLVTWNDRSFTESSFELHLRSGPDPWQQAAVVGANVERAVMTGLSPATTYRVRVRARGRNLDSEWSPKTIFTLPARLVRPDPVEATILSATRVVLTWNDRSTDEDGFEVGVRTVPGRWVDAATVAADVGRLVLTGLTPQTTYRFRVRARNLGGLSEWSPQPRITMPVELVSPDELQATILSPTRVRLEWRDRSDDEDSFEVRVRTGQGPWADAAVVAANRERVVITDLTAGTTCSFRVRARSSVGLSGWSQGQTVTMPAGPAVAEGASSGQQSPI